MEVIPWIIADSNYVIPTSQKLDPKLTVFVGALHGKLTADGLAKIMNDLFDGVVYAGELSEHQFFTELIPQSVFVCDLICHNVNSLLVDVI